MAMGKYGWHGSLNNFADDVYVTPVKKRTKQSKAERRAILDSIPKEIRKKLGWDMDNTTRITVR